VVGLFSFALLVLGVHADDSREVPNFALGLGTVIGGQALVQARAETGLPGQLLFEPQVAVLFPRFDADGAFAVEASVRLDAARRLGARAFASAGLGMQFESLFSEGRNVSNGGNFVTPGGSALNWLFTANLGAGLWLDARTRLDLGAAVAQLLDDARRTARLQIGVAYVL
jgi:hypothetical protein